MKRLVVCSTDAKRFAQKIISERFDDVICGNFTVPSQQEMRQSIKYFIDYSFDEYQVASKVVAKHPHWTEKQINEEVYRLKTRYNNEYRQNLRQAASEAVTEIENLLGSLNGAIKTWRIKNLE